MQKKVLRKGCFNFGRKKIVLLILAGVTIATLTGKNGILTQAQNAKEETRQAELLERVQLETGGSFDNVGKYDVNKAIKNLKNNLKIADENITKIDDETLIVKYKEYKILVDKNGKAMYGLDESGANFPNVPNNKTYVNWTGNVRTYTINDTQAVMPTD